MTLQQKLFSFQGRLRRRDFWLWFAAQWGIWIAYYIVITLVALILGVSTGELSDPTASPSGATMALLVINAGTAIALLTGLFWVNLAVQIKRCHDRNQSGWFVL